MPRWFVVLHADVAGSDPLPATGQAAGVDLGLKDFAVLSTGEHILHPQHMERHEQRLKRTPAGGGPAASSGPRTGRRPG